MNKIKYSLIVFSIFFVNLLCAQANSSVSGIDSLNNQVPMVKEENRAKIYNQISSKYKFTNSDSSFIYAQKALDISKKYKILSQEALALKNIGHYYIDKMKNDTAIIYFNNALDKFEKIGDKKMLLNTYVEIAHSYSDKMEYDKAYKILLKALKISEDNNILQGMINVNNGIGMVLKKSGKFKDALDYFNKALDLEKSKENSNPRIISNILSNIGYDFYLLEEYDKALEYFIASQKEYSNPKDYYRQMTNNNYLAIVYSAKGNHKQALKYYRNALEYAKKSNLDYLIAAALQNIGQELEYLHRYKESIEITKKSLEITKKNNLKDWQKEEYHTLYLCYDSLDNKDSALYYFKLYHDLNDSLKIEETNLKVTELQTKYQTEKKDKQIQLLAKDNEINAVKLKRKSTIMYAVVAFAILGLLFSLIYFKLLRQRQKARELIKQQEAELKFTENLRNYYKLANMLPLVTFFVDKNRQIKYINDFGLKLFKINKEKIENGVDIFDAVIPVNKDYFQKDILKVYDNQNVFEKQYQFNIEDKKYYFAGFFSPNVENDIVTGILGVLIDITRLKEMQKEIEITAINTENKERKRFSADLHDGLGPLLSSIKLFISGLDSASEDEKQEIINYVKNLIDDSIKSVRIISNNILPVSLTEKGLIEAINSFSQKLKLSKGIDISIEKINIDDFHFDNDTKAILFRVLQELINNTIKHAEASQINIKFEKDQNQIKIQYSDNGKGFDFDKTVNSDKAGLGLKNILNRINTLGGTIYFSSEEGKGLTVDIYFDT